MSIQHTYISDFTHQCTIEATEKYDHLFSNPMGSMLRPFLREGASWVGGELTNEPLRHHLLFTPVNVCAEL